ncbi:MAG TPA: aspartyl/glutamyl-tRNA amidotransferase subunit C [Gemmatimonadales bacterium]|nr:aspartyl/glutamyl-tRNA amidotransferase subunit C [Gemmatimonadales bacterium]
MKIGREEVLHVARLAELDVPAADVEGLVAQIGRIVEYVAQLDQVPAGEQAEPFQGGPERVALREDVPGSVPLVRGPESFAPEFRDGLFLVPRLGSMEGE